MPRGFKKDGSHTGKVFKKGHKTWNKGKTGVYSEEIRKKIGEASKRMWRNPKHREKMREYRKKWRDKNREKKREGDRKYARTIRKRKRKQRRRIDPKFRLDSNMSSMVSVYLKGKKARQTWKKLVGYTINDLVSHLEKQFDENMNWNNYGSYWHIDHIKPKSLFKYIYPEDLEFKKCWALENLQPLEAIANIKKSNHFKVGEKNN